MSVMTRNSDDSVHLLGFITRRGLLNTQKKIMSFPNQFLHQSYDSRTTLSNYIFDKSPWRSCSGRNIFVQILDVTLSSQRQKLNSQYAQNISVVFLLTIFNAPRLSHNSLETPARSTRDFAGG